jgi:hypothetical protein
MYQLGGEHSAQRDHDGDDGHGPSGVGLGCEGGGQDDEQDDEDREHAHAVSVTTRRHAVSRARSTTRATARGPIASPRLRLLRRRVRRSLRQLVRRRWRFDLSRLRQRASSGDRMDFARSRGTRRAPGDSHLRDLGKRRLEPRGSGVEVVGSIPSSSIAVRATRLGRRRTRRPAFVGQTIAFAPWKRQTRRSRDRCGPPDHVEDC